MRIPVKLVFPALILTLGLAALGLFSGPQLAQANPTAAPTINGGTIAVTVSVGSTALIAAVYTDDTNAPNPTPGAYLRSTNSAVGTFLTSPFPTVTGGLTHDEVITVQSMACPVDTLPCVSATEDTTLVIDTKTLTATFQCTAEGTTQFILRHNDVDSAVSPILTCTTVGGTGLIIVTAAPNALICGGTVNLTAAIRDTQNGGNINGIFHFQTDVGQILQQSDTTAILALLPNHPNATVTASTVGIPLGGTTPQVLTGTVIIQNYCGSQIPSNNGPLYAVSVVAAPNIIPCGGTANITATARDASGVIIPGVGFSFTTDAGNLIVGPPNQASATAGTATLTLLPGQGKTDADYDAVGGGGVRTALVTASVGGSFGTVKVQQYCPGVTTDGSVAPGKIVLNPSNTTVNCNGNAFIGAIVKDSKGQVPANDTEVTFIATSGFFTSATGTTGAATTTTSATPASGGGPSQTQTITSGQYIAKTTKNGALNVIYNAGPGSNGQVSITAAAGASFGSTTITVNCPGAISAASFGVAGAGGILRPPNTGEGRIRPPSTGDAGLAQ